MTTFWRVTLEDTFHKQIMLDRGVLSWPRGVSAENLAPRMRVGDALVWGEWLGKIGRISGIGLISAIEDTQIKVAWKEVQPFHVEPEPQGRQYWEDDPIFAFDDKPAQRYQLAKLLT